jgi:hypothetical protein
MISTLHIVVAMKPLEGNFTQNALKHGVAGINVDGCRIASETLVQSSAGKGAPFGPGAYPIGEGRQYQSNGRWPANVILEDNEEVVEGFPDVGKSGRHGKGQGGFNSDGSHNCFGKGSEDFDASGGFNDSGSASRFFKQVKS